jgi:hypothetical protein
VFGYFQFMNITQQQLIINDSQKILDLDINTIFIESYPNESDLSKININKYNAAQLIGLIKKSISQLKSEVANGYGLLLPCRENFQNDWGQISLDSELTLILIHLQSKQFDLLEPLIDKFIYYQIRYGFWDRSSIQMYSIEGERVKEVHNLIELNSAAINKNIKLQEKLFSDLDKKLFEISDLIFSKNNDLEKIEDVYKSANEKLPQLVSILADAKNKNTEIDGILKNLNSKVETLSLNIENNRTDFSNIKEVSKSLNEDIKVKIEEVNLTLETALENNKFIESRKSLIENLTGLAADGALGSKFGSRQGELDKKVKNWIFVLPFMTILTISWVIIVFTCLRANLSNEYFNLIVNILKTSPAFLLLGFVFSQYTKERNLQEEYAFKAAVAMTLTAYSNLLENVDLPENKSRQDMLTSSIELLYKQPKIHSEKNNTLLSLNARNLNESVKKLTDLIKEIKN